MAASSNNRNTQKTITLVDGAGTEVDIDTVGGITYTKPLRAIEEHRETGDIKSERYGQQEYGTLTFSTLYYDLEDGAGGALAEILQWDSSAARSAYTPTNGATAACVDNARVVPTWTFKEVNAGCGSDQTETLTFLYTFLSAPIQKSPNANGAGGTLDFQLRFRTLSIARSG